MKINHSAHSATCHEGILDLLVAILWGHLLPPFEIDESDDRADSPSPAPVPPRQGAVDAAPGFTSLSSGTTTARIGKPVEVVDLFGRNGFGAGQRLVKLALGRTADDQPLKNLAIDANGRWTRAARAPVLAERLPDCPWLASANVRNSRQGLALASDVAPSTDRVALPAVTSRVVHLPTGRILATQIHQ